LRQRSKEPFGLLWGCDPLASATDCREPQVRARIDGEVAVLDRSVADPAAKRPSLRSASAGLFAVSVRQERCAMKWLRDSTAPLRLTRSAAQTATETP
jgi:hypothetical protein